jgi:hypothetical protein
MLPRSSSALNTNSSILHQASSQDSIYEQVAAKIVNPRQIVGGRGQAVNLLTFYGGSQQKVVPPLNIESGHKGGVPGLKEWDNKGGAKVYTKRTETLLR